VESNKKYYVISERGKDAHWVQNVNHNPKITISLSNKTFEATARVVNPVKEPGLAGRISDLMSRKYKWSEGLIMEINPLGSS